jgi:microcystin-dependent protein
MPIPYSTGASLDEDEVNAGFCPIGTMLPFAGSTPVGRWLLCDGAAVSRTTYARLFAIIGETYGAGDGSTTFNLPNLKGRVLVGLDAAQTEFDTLGEVGGAKTHTLTTAELPAHTHNLRVAGGGGLFPGAGGNGDSGSDSQSGSTGSGGAHNNLQPYIAINFIINY